MKRNKVILIGLAVLLFGLQGTGLPFEYDDYKPGSEPDGFRSIKWGADISSLEGMEYFRTDPGYGGIKIYTKEKDNLQIGSANLIRIEYLFWRGKFCSVWVYTKGSTNWYGLKEAVFEKFGKGYQKNQFIEAYTWFGKITWMRLEYSEFSKEGKLRMVSREIIKQQEAYKKQKAKEGAETGF